MSQSTKPPSKEPFVGTEEILARVRVAQGTSFSRAKKLLAASFVAASALATAGILWLLAAPHQPKSSPATEESAAASPPVSAINPSVQEMRAHIGSVGDRGLLKVQTSGHAAAILVDGHVVSTGRSWQGQLSFGPHLVEVRCAGRDLRRRVVAGHDGHVVRVNCASHTLAVDRAPVP